VALRIWAADGRRAVQEEAEEKRRHLWEEVVDGNHQLKEVAL
jgi:hypothetical protein